MSNLLESTEQLLKLASPRNSTKSSLHNEIQKRIYDNTETLIEKLNNNEKELNNDFLLRIAEVGKKGIEGPLQARLLRSVLDKYATLQASKIDYSSSQTIIESRAYQTNATGNYEDFGVQTEFSQRGKQPKHAFHQKASQNVKPYLTKQPSNNKKIVAYPNRKASGKKSASGSSTTTQYYKTQSQLKKQMEKKQYNNNAWIGLQSKEIEDDKLWEKQSP